VERSVGRRLAAAGLVGCLGLAGASAAAAATLVIDGKKDPGNDFVSEITVTPGDAPVPVQVFLTVVDPAEDLADVQLHVVRSSGEVVLSAPSAVKGVFDRAEARVDATGAVRGLWHSECRAGPVTGENVHILTFMLHVPVESDGGFEATLTFVKALAGSTRARPVSLDSGSTLKVTVLAGDTEPPSITSPGDRYFEATSADGAIATYAANVTDNWSHRFPFTVTYAPPSGTLFALGSTPVKVTAVDGAGNSSSLHFNVIVQDTTPPVPACPPPLYVEATSANGALVDYPDASATDIVTASPALAYQPPDGSQLPLGPTTVTVKATDDAGNPAECQFVVTVRDTTPPALTLPPHQYFEATSPQGAYVTFQTASATDGVTAQPTIVYSPAQGSLLAIGTHDIAVTATDQAGKSTTGSFQVTVQDTIPPVITGAVVKPPVSGTDPEGRPWYDADPTVHFTGTDSGSGVASVTPDVVVSMEGKDQSIPGTATDVAGHSSQTTVSVSLDKTAPQVAAKVSSPATPSGHDGTRPWYRSAEVTVAFEATDAMSGVKTVSPAQKLTAEGADQTASGSATDHAGNTGSAEIQVSIDRTPPAVTISGPAANENGWYGAPPTFAFSATDALSGVRPESITAPITLGEARDQSISGAATDHAGNQGSKSRGGIHVDLTAPSIEAKVANPAEPTGWDGAAAWYNVPVTVDFPASDALSGVAEVTAPVTVATEGAAQRVEGAATDLAGNRASAEALVNVDLTPPVVTISAPAPVDGWYNKPTTFSFAAADALSGVEDGSVSAAKVLREGKGQSVSGSARDKAGNTGSATRTDINIDETPPTLTIQSDPLEPNANGWWRTDVTFSFTATDALSTVDPATVPPPVVKGEGANQSVSGEVRDKAGNTGYATRTGIHIDKTAPSVRGDVISPEIPAPSKDGRRWFNADVTVRFSAEDALSGVASVTPDQTVASEGKDQPVSGSATDLAGNTGQADAVLVSLDKTAPTIKGVIAAPAAPGGQDPQGRDWYSSDVTVRFEAADAGGSGIATSTPDQVVSTEGAGNEVQGTAVDLARNSASDKVIVNLDKTAPASTPSIEPAAKEGWHRTPVTVALAASDSTSGLAKIEYDLDSKGWTLYAAPVKVEAEGEHTLAYRATDWAGNLEEAKTLTIKIDLTVPEAFLRFDAPARDVLCFGRDAGGSGIAAEAIRPLSISDDTRTYEVADAAGNKLLLSVKVRRSGKRVTASVLSTRYGSEAGAAAPANRIEVEWSQPSTFVRANHQKLWYRTDSTNVYVRASWRWAAEGCRRDDDDDGDHDDHRHSWDLPDETVIVDSRTGEKLTLPGLRYLRMTTKKGAVDIEYDRN
jgi:hypothetical protein